MKDIWNRLESWMESNAPQLLEQLNHGALQSEINILEGIIKKKLPDDFIDFYKIHDGQDYWSKGREGIIDSEELLPISRIANHWEVLQNVGVSLASQGLSGLPNPDNRIKSAINPFWIPFTDGGSGDFLFIDLDPTILGNYGQVVRYWRENSPEWIANSFTEYISNYVQGLENGKYVYVKNWGLVNKDCPLNQP